MSEKPFPVKEGDCLRLVCEKIHEKGDGIFWYRGLAIFVPNTVLGHEYNIEIIKTRPKVAIGKIIQPGGGKNG